MCKLATNTTLVTTGLLALCFMPGPTWGQQSHDQQRCLNALLKDGSRVASEQGKRNLSCVRDLGLPSTCLSDDPQGKVERKKQKTIADAERKCETPPTIGFIDPPNDATKVNAVNMDGSMGLVQDVFGAPLAGGLSSVKQDARCQQKTYRRVQKLLDTHYGIYVSCLRDAFASGSDETAFDDCLTGANGIAGDPRGKIAKAELKLSRDVERHCAGAADSGLFSGVCAGLDSTELTECLVARTKCTMCWVADDLLAHGVNCDDFDDGAPNESCHRSLNHKCTFLTSTCDSFSNQCALSGAPCSQDTDCAGEASNLQIAFQFLVTPPIPVGGAIDIDCGDGTLGPNGTASCSCEIQSFDPIILPGTGTLCVTPGDIACPAGKIDCDGGSDLSWSTIADHDIGPCSSNSDCAAQCSSHCSSSSSTMLRSGCENFCEGGSMDGHPCTEDSDCPGASCNGPDGGAHGQICGCQCLEATGPSSAAVGMACNLPIKMKLVLPSGAPCNNPPSYDFPPVCMPLTTNEASSVVSHANLGSGSFGASTNGMSFDCPDFFTSVTAGASLAGTSQVFDTSYGDWIFLSSFVCQ